MLDGASEELLDAFGEDGRPSRVAVGVGVTSRPGGSVVDVSLVVAVRSRPARAAELPGPGPDTRAR